MGADRTSRRTSRSSARSSRRSRPGKYGVTVAVHEGRQVIAVWPGFHETAYGVAIDVGSTTIAGHLANLADGAVLASDGVMNPQIRFGEDLMSRVSYAMMHPEGAGEMTAAVRKALDGLIATLADAGRRSSAPRSSSWRSSATRSCTTSCSASTRRRSAARRSRWPPTGRSGRRPPSSACARTRAPASTSCRASPATSAPTRPGVILAEEPHEAERMTLVVDVGTNAEIVLGDRRRLLAASSPTGPAFEGAQISGGQRAAPGAIERVRIDRDDARAALPGHRRRRLVRRAGLRRGASRETGITGICGSGIIEVVAELFLAGVVTEDGVIDGALAARTPRIVPDGRTFSYVLHDGDGPAPARGSPSPRTTSGPSSSPRPRSTPASGC